MYGPCKGFGVKGISEVVGKMDIVHQLQSSQEVPQKVLGKEGNPEKKIGAHDMAVVQGLVRRVFGR